MHIKSLHWDIRLELNNIKIKKEKKYKNLVSLGFTVVPQGWIQLLSSQKNLNDLFTANKDKAEERIQKLYLLVV